MGIAQVIEKKGRYAAGFWTFLAQQAGGAPSPHCFCKGLTRQGLVGGGRQKN